MKKVLQGTIAGAIAVFALVGGFIQFDAHYTPRAYHNLCMATQDKKIDTIQQNSMIQRTQDEVFHWTRMEFEMERALERHPNDRRLQKQLKDAIDRRRDAENRLKALQGR